MKRHILLFMVSTSAFANGISVYGELPTSARVLNEEQAPLPLPALSGGYEIYNSATPVTYSPLVTPYDNPGVQERPPSHAKFLGAQSAVIKKGTFRENMVSVAAKFDFGPIVWDPRTKHCIWSQETEYRIEGREPKELLAFYAGTQDFKLAFSNVDEHIQAIYTGPEDRLKPCHSPDGEDKDTRPEILAGPYVAPGATTHIKSR